LFWLKKSLFGERQSCPLKMVGYTPQNSPKPGKTTWLETPLLKRAFTLWNWNPFEKIQRSHRLIILRTDEEPVSSNNTCDRERTLVHLTRENITPGENWTFPVSLWVQPILKGVRGNINDVSPGEKTEVVEKHPVWVIFNPRGDQTVLPRGNIYPAGDDTLNHTVF